VVKRVKFDAAASGEAGSPSRVRQSETPPRRLPLANAQTDKAAGRLCRFTTVKRSDRRDGRFCADIGAEPLVRIKDMPFVSRLDLVTKSLRQNDPEFAGNALERAERI